MRPRSNPRMQKSQSDFDAVFPSFLVRGWNYSSGLEGKNKKNLNLILNSHPLQESRSENRGKASHIFSSPNGMHPHFLPLRSERWGSIPRRLAKTHVVGVSRINIPNPITFPLLETRSLARKKRMAPEKCRNIF